MVHLHDHSLSRQLCPSSLALHQSRAVKPSNSCYPTFNHLTTIIFIGRLIRIRPCPCALQPNNTRWTLFSFLSVNSSSVLYLLCFGNVCSTLLCYCLKRLLISLEPSFLLAVFFLLSCFFLFPLSRSLSYKPQPHSLLLR